MSKTLHQDEETEEPPAPTDTVEEGFQKKGKRRSFRGVRRELSEEELKSPAVQKTLLDELERLDSDLADAKDYERQFHELDKKEAVLRQKFKTYKGVELLSTATLTAGASTIGFVVGIWANQPTAGVFLGIGIVLLIAGLLAKVIRL